jgi:antitoxin (DNA-binding transcriptional repressor) of toxin-antitoxin stability system
MAVVHILEDDAERDFAALLARVRAGEEIVIEKEALPAVILRVAAEPRGRLLSESIALAEAHAKELGYAPLTWKRSSATAGPATLRHGTDPRLQRAHRGRTARRDRQTRP